MSLFRKRSGKKKAPPRLPEGNPGEAFKCLFENFPVEVVVDLEIVEVPSLFVVFSLFANFFEACPKGKASNETVFVFCDSANHGRDAVSEKEAVAILSPLLYSF